MGLTARSVLCVCSVCVSLSVLCVCSVCLPCFMLYYCGPSCCDEQSEHTHSVCVCVCVSVCSCLQSSHHSTRDKLAAGALGRHLRVQAYLYTNTHHMYIYIYIYIYTYIYKHTHTPTALTISSLQVCWDDTAEHTRHPTGSNGRFELTPFEEGFPRAIPHVRNVVVEAALTWQRARPTKTHLWVPKLMYEYQNSCMSALIHAVTMMVTERKHYLSYNKPTVVYPLKERPPKSDYALRAIMP